MQRLTISIDDDLAADFDQYIERHGYQNRSEAVRDLIRGRLDAERQQASPGAHCVASLSFVYDHHERALSERLAEHQHERHDLTVAAMHVHLDHHHCLETVVLQGETVAVRAFAASITAEPGVRHGSLNLVTMEDVEPQDHAGHRHRRPKY